MRLSPFTTGYAAAGGSLFSQVMAGFLANSGTATEDISPSRRVLVSRARALDISCPMATAAVDRMVHGVLGDGLSYSIGNSDFFERDEYQALCGGLKKSLKLASMTHSLDIQGRLTFAQMQRMACRNWLLSGDVFFVRRPNRTNCAWRIIESDRCLTPSQFNTNISGLKAINPDNGNTIIDGVEINAGGYKKICVNLRSHSVWLGGGMDIRRGLWQRKKNQQLDVSKIAIHEPKK